MNDIRHSKNMDKKSPHLTKKCRYKKRKKKPSLIPLTRDPFYVPPPPEEIKKALEILLDPIPELELLKPKQLQAIELILDYLGKNQKPELCNIAKKTKIDSRTLSEYLVHDANFNRVLDVAINKAYKSNLMISFARMCIQAKTQPEIRRLEIMATILGLKNRNIAEVNKPKKVVSVVDPETREVRFIRCDESQKV